MRKLCYMLNLLVLLMAVDLQAQFHSQLRFTHVGLDEGLSQSTVLDIVQDSQGNMWFATQDGLNRFNGYDFTVYRHDDSDTTSISNDCIYALDIGHNDRLWIGTDAGLSCYDPYTDRFRNFYIDRQPGHKLSVSHVAAIDSLHLFVLSMGRLYSFDVCKEVFHESRIPGHNIGNFHSLTNCDSVVYIGTDKGLYAYSKRRLAFEKFPFQELEGKMILTALMQPPSYLWVATEGEGLYRFDMSDGNVRHYTSSGTSCLASDYVRSLALDSWNRLWVGTYTSLSIYRSESDSFESYVSDPANPQSLSQTSVRSIYRDVQGGMWLGTYFGGLSYYHPLKRQFRHISRLPGKNSLNDNVISCITEDSKNKLWIGTNGGVNVYDQSRDSFRHYTVKDGLGSNDIKSIWIDEDKQVAYIGGHVGGLSILNLSNGKIDRVASSTSSAAAQSIYAIYPKNKQELWVGTLESLQCFDKRTKTFTDCSLKVDGQPFRLSNIQMFFQDSKQRLWISGREGFYTFRVTDTGLEVVRLLPEGHELNKKEVLCVYEQDGGVFWIGTRDGLFRFAEAKREVKRYTVADGLPNNLVYGILEDSYGKLWISTDYGLSCLFPEDGSFRNYTAADGLQSNQFTSYAYYRTRSGQMYFGGVNGLTAFYPEQLSDNPYAPSVIFTELRLFNRPVRPGDKTGILKQHISRTKEITFSADQSMFSLEFVVPNYIAGNHNTFAYKLDGYDEEWYQTNTLRTVSYSNLPQGTYHFLVKAANNDGIWNEFPSSLKIVVLPVWYDTWWARLLFVLVAIGCITFVVRYFWTQKVMESRIEMERVDKERQKEMNEMKLRFFINISHELRTPLTLILAPLQDLLAKVDDRWMRRQLEHIKRNADRLLHLVNQLMDYRRAELGVFQLKVRPVYIHQVIEKNFLFYERLAQRKQIAYRFVSEVEQREILCDPDYLELIENNLLSNAFKYTGEGQSITVLLKEENGYLILQVKDTGSGIPIGKQDKIFERFYQVDSEHPGSGIGLSLVQRLVELHHGRIELDSQEGVGSTFTVFLPVDEASYSMTERAVANTEQADDSIHTTNHPDMYIVDTEEDMPEEEMVDGEKEQEEERTSKKEHILVVEDNVDIRRYLSEELGHLYQVESAGNGEEALEILKRQEIDLVLTDVMMPVMDGLQLCRSIKQNMNTCHIPVIILSAKADVKEQLEGLQVGADDYIPKPFVLNVVVAKIRNLFRTRYMAIEYYSKSDEIVPEKIALNPLDEKILKQAMEIVERHLDDTDFSTDEFAREMCMSRSNLHLKMKALTGESTNEFIRKMRLNRACKLLKEGKYSVAEISVMVGFNTPSYFTISFKKYFGCLPSEYAKEGR